MVFRYSHRFKLKVIEKYEARLKLIQQAKHDFNRKWGKAKSTKHFDRISPQIEVAEDCNINPSLVAKWYKGRTEIRFRW